MNEHIGTLLCETQLSFFSLLYFRPFARLALPYDLLLS